LGDLAGDGLEPVLGPEVHGATRGAKWKTEIVLVLVKALRSGRSVGWKSKGTHQIACVNLKVPAEQGACCILGVFYAKFSSIRCIGTRKIQHLHCEMVCDNTLNRTQGLFYRHSRAQKPLPMTLPTCQRVRKGTRKREKTSLTTTLLIRPHEPLAEHLRVYTGL
jgi:hypothetical protein